MRRFRGPAWSALHPTVFTSLFDSYTFKSPCRIADSISLKTGHAVEPRARSSAICCPLEMLQISSAEEFTSDTCDSGPALSGKLLVFRTWIPAIRTPVDGVLLG